MSRRLNFDFLVPPPVSRSELIRNILSAKSSEGHVKAVIDYRGSMFPRSQLGCMTSLSTHDEEDKGALLAMSKCL